MFDYCGDIYALYSDYENLLLKVINEIFPTIKCTVRIRKTKAMVDPKISISIVDGPLCKDFRDAILLLAQMMTNTRWAYCGKVLPDLGYWIRSNPKSNFVKQAQAVWEQIRLDYPNPNTSKTNWCCEPSMRRVFKAMHKRRLSELMNKIHPAQQSATMKLIACGYARNINQLAVMQRRDNLDLATPLAMPCAVATNQVRRGRL